MRVVVFFDLPTTSLENKREYRRFRKFLISKGFYMLQESVYCKLTLNKSVANRVMKSIRENSPDEGLIQMLIVTEKQFSKMEYVIGESTSSVLDSDERLVII